MSKDYYKILDVDRNSSEDEIKKAYKKKVKECHPDLHMENKEEFEEKFKEVQEAYDVLNDTLKRNQYDKYGEVFNGAFPSGQRAGNNIVFNFGNFNFRKTYEKKIQPINLDVSLTISEVFNGVKKDLFCLSEEKCLECNGNGISSNGSVKKCEICNGMGEISMGGIAFITHICQICNGTGEIITLPCKKCHGKKTEKLRRTVTIDIPKGVMKNNILTIQQAGNYCSFNKKRGDINIRINVLDDYIFSFHGHDFICVMPLKIEEAIFGCQKTIPTPHGKISIDIPKNIQPNSSLKVKDKGMRKGINSDCFGDLIIQIIVEIPKVSNEDKEKIENIKMDYKIVNEFNEKIKGLVY